MKRTQYFESVEAVNQYYPDGVPSTVIAIVGDGSNVFVSSDNAASGNQQYYSAEMTNDDIVAEQVSAAESQGYETGYAAGETAGYDTGYAAGQAAGSTNWLDVLYLDEKAKAETALNVTEWSDSQKYNFANDAANDGSCVNPQTAPALITGVLQDATISKVIKISKDVNDNAVITYHNCYINFDGTNLGAISLDGVTYYNKMCIWSEPITLAVDDEIIWGVAASLSGTSIFLFGGYDPDAYEMVGEEGQTHKQWKAATYKCTTAGTYTFGMTIDLPQASNPQAIAFVSTMFNYEGSATVPAITVPTGETSGGGATYTDQQKFAISSSDMMVKGSLNNINYNTMTPFNFDTTIWEGLTQMSSGHYAVLYKWSGNTMTTLPFYSNYDEEVGTSPVSINVGTQDELEIQDSLVYATATLAAGDKICVGFYISDEYSKTGQLSGITSASTLYTVQTAGDYIIVIYTAGYDDETGEPLPPTTVVSSNSYNASGTVLPMQPVQS